MGRGRVSRGRRKVALLIALTLAVQVAPASGAAQTPPPPRILWLTVSPSSLDYAVGGPVTVTMGIDSDAESLMGYVQLRGPSGSHGGLDKFYTDVFLSETAPAPDGTRVLSGTETFAPWKEYGTWSVHTVSVNDFTTEVSLSTPTQIAAYPLAAPTLSLTGVLDLEPPQITAIEISPSFVNWSEGGAIEVTVHATDDVSGVFQGSVSLGHLDSLHPANSHPPGDIQVTWYNESYLVSGSVLDGAWRAGTWLNSQAEIGDWGPFRIHIRDRYGNVSNFEWPDTLDDIGITLPTFEVIDDRDHSPPVIHGVATTPVWFAAGNPGTVEIEIEFSDEGGGFDDASFQFNGPEGGIFHVSAFSLTGGTVNAGTARGVGTLPVDAEPGIWRVVAVWVRDLGADGYTMVPLAILEESGVVLPVITVDDGSGRPSVPRNVTVTPGAAGEIDVSWLPPAFVGESPIEYDLAVRVAPGLYYGSSTPVGDGMTPDIVGGFIADIAAYPWQAAMLVGGVLDAGIGQFCGASLIAARWAVTAAHCVDERQPGEIHLAFGETLLSEVDILDRVPVDLIIIHPDWDEPTMTHDIALLHLAGTPADGHTIAIATDPDRPLLNEVAHASGWGNFVSADPIYAGYLPDPLLAVLLSVRAGPDDSTCASWGDLYDPQAHLCAGSSNAYYRGTCVGDSGGPLFVTEFLEQTAYLVGVTSFGAAPESGDCGYPLLPSVFTRVSTHADWIGSWVDGVLWNPLPSQSSLGVTIGGLDPGFKYEVAVTARNDAGSSPPLAARGYTGGAPEIFPWPQRLAGGNRFGTAAAVAEAAFPDPVDTVFVATGYGFADALTGAAVAGQMAAPLLLVGPNSVPSETMQQLQRLSPETIVILGGTAVVSEGVETLLGSVAATVRLAGGNRFSTAVAISQFGFPDGAAEVVIANGFGFADALAGAPAAARLGGPVLLTNPTHLPPEVIAEIVRLAPDRIVVLGGASVVSTAVFDQLASLAPEAIRLFGPNRYSTAIAVNQFVFPNATTAYLATGLNFPDALTAAAAAAAGGHPLYLVAGSAIPAGLVASMAGLGIERLIVVGGTSVISDQVPLLLGPLFVPG